MIKNSYQNKIQDERLLKIEGHIEVINSELGEIKESQARNEEKLDWLAKSYWIVATASVGGLIGAIINLIVKK